uniref:peptidylprolyl isomerase n=1 Tax=Odontella aurita TaxID=265563 RepID=A0A7S4ND52_9STRA|mmetsp:Transcript_59702/g.176902  ORF Transcript_59702/g.176902 Transcript_59702/m.176902 type:complete len:325 (+) Transcript_59702:35-1009(+)
MQSSGNHGRACLPDPRDKRTHNKRGHITGSCVDDMVRITFCTTAMVAAACRLLPVARTFVPQPSLPACPARRCTFLSSSSLDDDGSSRSDGRADAEPSQAFGSAGGIVTRRSLFSTSSQVGVAAAFLSAVAVSASNPDAALAGIDPSALKSLRVEGDASGSTTRLQQIEAAKNAEIADVTVDKPWEDLPSGVLFREYREGRGDAVVQPGSKVAVEMTIRCKSFSTANEPGGVKYFSTKEDTDFNELAFTVGSGEMLPGLEEGMMGMRKGGLRRVEVPSTMVFAARKEGQLPLPSEKNKDGKRRFDSLFKTDATVLIEVLVTRIK